MAGDCPCLDGPRRFGRRNSGEMLEPGHHRQPKRKHPGSRIPLNLRGNSGKSRVSCYRSSVHARQGQVALWTPGCRVSLTMVTPTPQSGLFNALSWVMGCTRYNRMGLSEIAGLSSGCFGAGCLSANMLESAFLPQTVTVSPTVTETRCSVSFLQMSGYRNLAVTNESKSKSPNLGSFSICWIRLSDRKHAPSTDAPRGIHEIS